MPFRAVKASKQWPDQTHKDVLQFVNAEISPDAKPNQGATFELPKKIPGLIFTAGGERSQQLFTMSLSDSRPPKPNSSF